MRRGLLVWLVVGILLSSCASLSRYPGVGRIRHYTISHPQVPVAFDGFRMAFASDFHLRSKYKERHLAHTVRALQASEADVLLLGGDYQEGCQYVAPLFAALIYLLMVSSLRLPFSKQSQPSIGCKTTRLGIFLFFIEIGDLIIITLLFKHYNKKQK
jgi:hypothetical protein